MAKIYRRILLLLCVACIWLGLLFRFAILHISYEYDEIFTAITSNPSLPLGWIWNNWLLPDVHPPLHNLFLYFYNHFVPYGPEIWLRLPSVVFSVGALACAWFMFPKRWGKTARLIFFSFLSCQLYGVLYAQHARAYALVLLFAMPLTFLFLNMSRAVYKRKNITAKQWIWFGVLSLLLSWTHYFGALAFGIFSILLFVQGWKYKQRLWPFILVPGVVFVLFLPWLVPNVWECISLGRFNGIWWANVTPKSMIIPGLIEFFFTAEACYHTILVIILAAMLCFYWQYKKKDKAAYMREIFLLTITLAAAFGIVSLFLLKMYLFMGRYFYPFLPSLFLLITLLIAPLIRKSNVFLTVFTIYMVFSIHATWWNITRYLLSPLCFPSRATIQYYLQNYPQKDLLVIALEAFPPAAMDSMYAFYPNQVYKQNKRVKEIYYLTEEERDKELENRENAAIWMPNCTLDKLGYLVKEWERIIVVEKKVGSSCFLRLSDKGVKEPPKEWEAVKISNANIW